VIGKLLNGFRGDVSNAACIAAFTRPLSRVNSATRRRKIARHGDGVVFIGCSTTDSAIIESVPQEATVLSASRPSSISRRRYSYQFARLANHSQPTFHYWPFLLLSPALAHQFAKGAGLETHVESPAEQVVLQSIFVHHAVLLHMVFRLRLAVCRKDACGIHFASCRSNRTFFSSEPEAVMVRGPPICAHPLIPLAQVYSITAFSHGPYSLSAACTLAHMICV